MKLESASESALTKEEEDTTDHELEFFRGHLILCEFI